MLIENSIWKNYERKEKTSLLRKLLELDSLPKIIDPQEVDSITAKFLFAANNKRQAFPQLIGIGGGPGAGKSFLYDHMKSKGMLPADSVIHDPDLVMQFIKKSPRRASRVDPLFQRG